MGAVRFLAPERARRDLAAVAAALPPEVVSNLLVCLADSANPDQALNLFERLVSESGKEFAALLAAQPQLVHYAVAIFAASQWLGETLTQNPELLAGFAQARDLERLCSGEDYREAFARFGSRSQETDISLLLAQFKRRQYVRILLRDVLNIATLAETTAEISALSDVLMEEALRFCAADLRRRYGWPQHYDGDGRLVETAFSVLALGKLGGNELNYSSDVDLLYLYGDGDDAGRAAISAREFFIRLAQELTERLERTTRAGPVFRIDLRLRPLGHEGEPAVRLGHALEYYAQVAQDWELQALIKARLSAGDAGLCRVFLDAVQPQIYREELNFAAVKTALVSLEKIQRKPKSRRAGSALDVKLDRGGIRDIEFLVQCLQRLYGGQEPWLQAGGTLFSLQKLHDKAHLSGQEYQRLTSAYVFLRRVEHRLQLAHGQQTHRLPASPAEIKSLQIGLTGEQRAAEPAAPVQELEEILRGHMAAVSEIYGRIVQFEDSAAQAEGVVGAPTSAAQPDGELGIRQIISRLAADSPELHAMVTAAPMGSSLRTNLLRFLGAACTSPVRYQAVLQHAAAVRRAEQIFTRSAFLTDILTRAPEVVELLAELPRIFSGKEHERECEALRERVRRAEGGAEAMHELRVYYRDAAFAAGVRDVLRPAAVWASLAELTAAADAVVSAALQACGAPPGLAVFGLGRLGAREFDLLSDADLLFVRGEELDPQQAQRTAESVVQVLSLYTREGPAFSVDTRLRPHGGQGELVITPPQLRRYMLSEAQPWEALAYQKLRYIAGEVALADSACASVAAMLARFRASESLREELHAMRNRLEASAGRECDVKLTAGGFYDLDFIAGYTTIRSGVAVPAANILERLYALEQAGALPAQALAELLPAAGFLRTLEHAIRLVEGRNRKSLPGNPVALGNVEWILTRMLGRPLEGRLESELSRWMQLVRRRFLSVMSD